MLDERAPSCAPSAASAVDSVQQLADGDNTDRSFLVPEDFLDRAALAFVGDEKVGVD